MGSNEKFCLRWNDFESNISVAFREIREEKDFFDCTLSVGDRQLQAHKLILSACSPFFRSVLRKNPHQHPLIYLKGVEFSDLQSVLNFMYHGEVNVAQEELNSFLAVAEDLKVKGLTQNNSSDDQSPASLPNSNRPNIGPPKSNSTPRPVPIDPPPPKRPRPPPQQYNPTPKPQDDDDIQEVMPVVKTEPLVEQHQQPTVTPFQQSTVQQQPTVTTFQQPIAQQTSSYSDNDGTLSQMEDQTGYGEDDGYDYGGYEDAYGELEEANKDINLSGVVLVVEQGFSCSMCGAQFSDKSNARRHVRSVHVYSQVNCNLCGVTLKNDRCLKAHMKNMHTLL